MFIVLRAISASILHLMGYNESAVRITVRGRLRVRFRFGLGFGLDSVRGSTISHKMKRGKYTAIRL